MVAATEEDLRQHLYLRNLLTHLARLQLIHLARRQLTRPDRQLALFRLLQYAAVQAMLLRPHLFLLQPPIQVQLPILAQDLFRPEPLNIQDLTTNS